MTLQSFKNNIKFVLVLVVLIGYGFVSYQFGRGQKLDRVLKIKGVKSQNSLESPVESPVPFADSQSAHITSSSVKLCSNTTQGFEIAYPNDWFTTYNSEENKCYYFAPYAFVVPQDTTNFSPPIKIEIVKPQDWPTAVKLYENPNDLQNVLSVEKLQKGSNFVTKVQAQSTSNHPQGQGLTIVNFLIFDSEKPMVIIYIQQNVDEDSQEMTNVLEEMVATAKYF